MKVGAGNDLLQLLVRLYNW